MNKNIIFISAALIALTAGFGGYAIGRNQTPVVGSHVMSNGSAMSDNTMGGMGGAMDDMMEGLQGKTSDEFDKAFLSEMIVHHQGAVLMAQAALENAKHQEIKQMAQNIISAQTSEIDQMQQWERNWYDVR